MPVSKSAGGTGTVIRPCKCESEYQDKKYGKGMRVHNVSASKSSNSCKCTVCGQSK